ncbi:hypothetical protein SK128_005178 [Halocaridina rubra]|uniref:Vitelline membrane outer layer protein 1 n=1 Tax=Halocaridina rubra TaxID=373956 RepID=A0AAN8X573_HALRR
MKISVIVLFAFLGSSYAAQENREIVESIRLDNGLNRGSWGPTDICPDGSWVTSMEIKYAPLGAIDDTALTGIKLYCQNADGSLAGTVMSSEADYGTWRGVRACNSGIFLYGMRGNVVPEQGGFDDDLGMDNLHMACTDGVILDGYDGVPMTKEEGEGGLNLTREKVVIKGREIEAVHVALNNEGRDAGDWSTWAYCSTGNRICGLETRVERDTTLTDDAGVVDVTMYCCSV